MAFEVAVVGGGIGGLTAAALLAARGVSVCLFERAPRGGGCAGSFQKFGYDFETTAGLYGSWGRGGVHERVFAELPVERPEARRLEPAYVVRLSDGADVRVGGGGPEFEETLRAAFPECAAGAVAFYRGLAPLASAAARALERFPALTETSKLRRVRLAAADPRAYKRLTAARAETVAEHLSGTSARFRAFLDAQLRAFALASADECSHLYAAAALAAPLGGGLYGLRGGAAALADALTESIKRSGGAVRFDATVLRLSYDAAGRATGVDLLSGENVVATRAVVSNLTAWDTYGKLVGAGRAPAEVRSRLKAVRGRGAYLIFLGADEDAIARLPATHLLAAAPPGDEADDPARDDDDPARSEFFFASSPAWDARAPGGKRAITVSTFAEAEDWFTFHEDETAHEEQDAAALEACWARLHAALPELGAGVEVVETLTPRDYYEQTRRRLGLVCGTPRTPAALADGAFTHRTHLPNLYMVGDTVFPGPGLANVTRSALAVADEIAPARLK